MYWSNHTSAPHFFPFVCVLPKSHDLGQQRHLTCKNISTVNGEKRTKGQALLSLPTQATGSLHPGRKEHVGSGNTWEQSLLIYSLSNKGPTFLQEPEGQDGLAGVGSVSWPQRKFIHSFIHFQKFKFRSLVLCEPVAICLNDLKLAQVGTESVLPVPKQHKPQWAGSSAPLSHMHCMKLSERGSVLLSHIFKSIPLVGGNMHQCLIIPTK